MLTAEKNKELNILKQKLKTYNKLINMPGCDDRKKNLERNIRKTEKEIQELEKHEN